mmetsp:Transcript_56298/g.131929  ORF Transcript_56298/g.131929 Transcript_56298/m.131929 type:complete len:150 (-) Transcript_56298:41-490(-)
MSLAAVPIGKLVWVAVRQAARPMANVAVRAAEGSPRFHDICIQVSRLVPSQRANIPDHQAVQIGCQVLSEAMVFTISSGVLIYEYQRSKEAEHRRLQQERDDFNRCITEQCSCLRAETAAAEKALRATVSKLEDELATCKQELSKIRSR